MKLELERGFTKKLQRVVERYQFEVGFLDGDKPHKSARPAADGLSTYAGGPVRKASRKTEGVTIAEVAKENADRIGVDFIKAPFEKKNSDINKFTEYFFKMIFKPTDSYRKRAVNLVQAIVRNPILRGDYGSNSKQAQKWKTFDRNMIDTAQMFKSITARLLRGGRRV